MVERLLRRCEIQRDGTGTIVLGGGSFTVGGLNSFSTFAGKFSGLGTVSKQGTGTWTLTETIAPMRFACLIRRNYPIGSSHALGGGNNIIQVGGRIQTASSLDVYGKLIFFGDPEYRHCLRRRLWW